jgi:hypothetical protein
MTEMREVVDYLHDILDAAESAEQFVAGMEFEAFAADKKTVLAVVCVGDHRRGGQEHSHRAAPTLSHGALARYGGHAR